MPESDPPHEDQKGSHFVKEHQERGTIRVKCNPTLALEPSPATTPRAAGGFFRGLSGMMNAYNNNDNQDLDFGDDTRPQTEDIKRFNDSDKEEDKGYGSAVGLGDGEPPPPPPPPPPFPPPPPGAPSKQTVEFVSQQERNTRTGSICSITSDGIGTGSGRSSLAIPSGGILREVTIEVQYEDLAK
ncbi:hypothetical protein B0T26DRAFT_753525 [Lasiosphaeria miniovina]|uniref:Uncharacterized protein n=1 Tax=Lasiosphaeria miniovina TaxID=1954250 RepID=A0AA40ACL9_9PEZI|nr:uncharacterized protein B0T26DRAFT_753525 [Lasiosphaeria miniovina]KAK0713414.1 hypothetical protein B0T26DRAFT_753525 [Lasiosphaeria miniovina]